MRTHKDYLHHLYAISNEEVMDMLEEEEAYSMMIRRLSVYLDQVDESMECYPEDTKTLLSDVRNLYIAMNTREKEEMYIKGYQDCFSFIRVMSGL